MRNATNRHVKTNVKNQVKQKVKLKLRDADCCYFCKHRGILYGGFRDCTFCAIRNRYVRHVDICDEYMRRE